jgi:hypothetical protein
MRKKTCFQVAYIDPQGEKQTSPAFLVYQDAWNLATELRNEGKNAAIERLRERRP